MLKEEPRNLVDPQFVDAQGVEDPLPSGVPLSWQSFESMPKAGTFRVRYCCAPEERNFAARVLLFERYGQWKLSVLEEDVMWWSALTEAPDDVQRFMEFIMGKYPDIRKVFALIDGPSGNGVISFQEFKEGIQTMKCSKFAGPDESRRVEA